MRSNEIREMIFKGIAEIAPGTNISAVDDSKDFSNQLDLDSMDFLDLIMFMRKHYQIEIPKEDFEKIRTINQFIDYLRPKFTQFAA